MAEKRKKAWDRLFNYFLDILFPIKCIACDKEGEWICKKCFSKIKIYKKQTCPKCFSKNKDGSFCKKCEIYSKMKGILVSTSYENKLLQKGVHILKYKYVKDLSKPLSKILAKGFQVWQKEHKEKLKNIVFIPVPLHKKRKNERGFNQTELLVEELNLVIKAKVEKNILRRIKNTKAQAKQDSLTRRKNIKGAFRIQDEQFLKDKIVFIVDDVCTTSSTLEECAKEIDKGKPREIWGLVLARGK